MKPMRYPILDLFRISALMPILVAHIGQTRDEQWAGMWYANGFYNLSLGAIGVTLFIMLSGVALGLNHKPIALGAFYWGRLVRIYPIYWMALIISVVVSRGPSFDTTTDVMLAVTGFCAFAGQGGCHLGPSWFIGLIISLYAIYPILKSAMANYPRITLIAALIISVLSRLIIAPHLPHNATAWFPLCRLFEFSLGLFLAQHTTLISSVQWNPGRTMKSVLRYLSELSFPAFLIHYPLLFLFWTFKPPISLPIYLATTLFLSHLVAKADALLHLSSITYRVIKSESSTS